MTNFASLRVSQDTQDLKNQKFGVLQYAKAKGIKNLHFVEDVSSSRVPWQKRGIGELLEKVEEGDVIVVAEISRMARTTLEALEISKLAVSKGVSIHIAKGGEVIDGTTKSDIMVMVFGMAAQIEREFISERTKEALARKKAEGVKLGRPKGSKSKIRKLDAHAKDIEKYLSMGLPKASICKLVGCSRPTLDGWLNCG